MTFTPTAEAVSIVGAGALGTALAHAFVAAKIPVVTVASRNRERADALAATLPGTRSVDLEQGATGASLVILAVSDSAIESAAAAVSPVPGALVAHTSGSRSAATMGALASRGAVLGGFHPLAAVVRHADAREVTSSAWASIFRGAAFAIEGSEEVNRRLAALATALGGHPFTITAEDKPLYHLGASMLAAFSAGLSQLAWDAMRTAGAPASVATAGVGHLLRTVSENVQQSPTPAHALTGPVARGDAAGVQRQAAAAGTLSADALALYRVHVRHSVSIAQAAGRIDAQTANILSNLLAH